MKNTTNDATVLPVNVSTTSAHALPDVWLSPRELSTLRKSISVETMQELFDYHEDLWDVVCRGRKLEYFGYAESGQVPQLDTFVRMLIADSKQLRGAKLKAAEDAQVAALRANWAMCDDSLWKLDGSKILVMKS